MGCNETTTSALDIRCLTLPWRVTFLVICTALVISLAWNIFACVSRGCSAKRRCQSRKRSRQSQRQMEENPIYGNLSFTQTSMTLLTEADPPHSREQSRVIFESQPKTQDCYANLSLKPPRVQSGRSSPQIEYSDVVHLEEPPDSQKEEGDEGDTDAVSTLSDLYASVQTQRTKTVNTADDGEGYANHL